MKVILLAGGFGSRFGEITKKIPKPLIKVNNKSIINHIIDHFSYYNFNDFIICCGYKYKTFFNHFIKLYKKNKKFKVKQNINKVELSFEINKKICNIILVNTGVYTNTGGRIKKIKKFLNDNFNDNYFLTYSDGLSNVNLNKLCSFHKRNRSNATVTVIKTSNQYGVVNIKKNKVKMFNEKPKNQFYINGGYFVINKSILNFIENNSDSWEQDCLPKIVKKGKLNAFKHNGFWQSMDGVNDKIKLEKYLKVNPKFYK